MKFSKMTPLVKSPVSSYISSSPVQISYWSANMALRYSQNEFQYGVCPPSWICKISIFCQKFLPLSGNLHLSTIFDQNRIIHGWDIEINYFQNGGRPPSWIFENCSSDHVTYIGIRFSISGPNFALIGQYGAQI